jgi:peptidoglycan/xylan/chitin deacetylase (PgdA/CDA1 family)
VFAGFGVVTPFFPPPDQPAAAPPPAAASQPPPGRAMRVLLPIRNVETHEPAVALTFDACATRSHRYSFDRNIFNVLKRERLPATIFVSGRWVEGHPDVMAELSVDPLVEFGDHSYDHPHMSHLPVARIVEEIDQTEAALAKYGKHSVAFRPPFGEWSARLIYVVHDLRLPTVTWDVVSGDPSAKTTTEGMIRNVVGKARPGSIIVFHINGRGLKTAQALPAIVRELRERGFRFVHVSELMAAGRAAPIPVPTAPAAPGPAMPLPVAPTPAATLPPPPPPSAGLP